VQTHSYSVSSTTTDFIFNSGNSVSDSTTTLDGYGRVTNVQKRQGPSSSTYDTVSTYRGFGTVIPTVETTNPCSAASGSQCATTYGPTAGGSVSAAGLVSTTLTQSGSNATATTTYNENDVTTITTPAPSGENSKGVESEYDGLGRITSSCAISSTVSGKVSCGQNTGGYSGILTTTTYSSATGSQTVKSCRGPSCAEYHQMKTDGLGRVLSKYTPEGGTWTYVYDANTSCPAGWRGASGELASITDPNGNLLCYSYDASNRVTGINANGTSCRWFYYDNSSGYTGTIPTGISLSNQYGRMVEAATDNCTAVSSHTSATLITDLWFAYDKDGHPTTQWESTPNSGGYYEATASFFGNGAVDVLTLASPSITTDTYTLDGEGRWNSMHAGGYQIVSSSGVTYNPAGLPTAITLSASTLGHDNYTYDANTMRMTQYQFQVGSGSSNTDTGVLAWNPIGSLKSLTITDDFNANGSITCSYNSSLVTGTGYDDLNRLIGHSCTGTGGTWSQTFGYDLYNNLTKTGSGLPSWSPGGSGYTPSNQYTCTGCTYDSNGNVTNDGTNAYTWNAFSKMASVNMTGTGCATNGDCLVYDALGRVVEIDDGSTQEEIWYTQLGKTAYMNGQTYLYGYFPGPGGGTLYNSSACPTCWLHKDWLGNARLVSRGVTVETDRAYAPYGEVFNVFGGTNQPWTMYGGGSTQDILAGMYDTPNRELQSTQGRFLSPDPAGSGWNQYAYPANPNSSTDPSGLFRIGPWYFLGSQGLNSIGAALEESGAYFGAFDFYSDAVLIPADDGGCGAWGEFCKPPHNGDGFWGEDSFCGIFCGNASPWAMPSVPSNPCGCIFNPYPELNPYLGPLFGIYDTSNPDVTVSMSVSFTMGPDWLGRFFGWLDDFLGTEPAVSREEWPEVYGNYVKDPRFSQEDIDSWGAQDSRFSDYAIPTPPGSFWVAEDLDPGAVHMTSYINSVSVNGTQSSFDFMNELQNFQAYRPSLQWNYNPANELDVLPE
jgi:RHS repeat-associated protein